MSFNFGSFVMNAFVLLFASAFLGLAFGKLKIGKFKFGLSGTLFAGLLLGWAVKTYAYTIPEGSALFKTAHAVIAEGPISKEFFDLFLILFIAAVGLLTGKDIARALKKYGLKFLIIGFVITFTGVAATYGFINVGKQYSAYQVSGIYTGALTSSPGLAASLETVKNQADSVEARYQELSNEDKSKVLKMIDKSGKLTPENTATLTKEQINTFIKNAQSDVSLGHTLAFPFGLLTIILSVVFLPKIFRIDVDKEREEFAAGMQEAAADSDEKVKEGKFNLMAFTFVCVLGYFLGTFKFSLPGGSFSLGTSGGVLVAALGCSHFGKIGPLNFRMENKTLGIIREIGLGLFLSTVGLMYGYDAVSVFGGSGAAVAMMGLAVVVISILMGFIVGRYVFKLNWMVLAGAICGGMTSTPGLGAATDATNSDYPAIGYGATYPFALIYKVVLLMILHKLFII